MIPVYRIGNQELTVPNMSWLFRTKCLLYLIFQAVHRKAWPKNTFWTGKKKSVWQAVLVAPYFEACNTGWNMFGFLETLQKTYRVKITLINLLGLSSQMISADLKLFIGNFLVKVNYNSALLMSAHVLLPF